MTGEAFVQIIIGLIMICSALITAYVIPFIQTKMDAVELEQFYSFTKKCVMWANQTIPAEEFKKKKEYVMKSVQEFIDNNLHIKLSLEQIDTIVEAFVIECKKGN